MSGEERWRRVGVLGSLRGGGQSVSSVIHISTFLNRLNVDLKSSHFFRSFGLD